MSSHDQIPEDIRKQIKQFESKLVNLRSLKGVDRQQNITKQEKHIKRIHRLMDTYKCSIESGAFEGTVATHKSQFKEFQVELNRLEKMLDEERRDLGTEEDLFRKEKSSKKVEIGNKNNRMLMVEEGDKALEEGQAGLKRGLRMVNQMDGIANEVMTELDRQINKLDTIYQQLNDTETTLKRAEQHLKYFARQVYTDRCLVFLIIIIALAIIVIIALAIAGKTPQQMNNKVQ